MPQTKERHREYIRERRARKRQAKKELLKRFRVLPEFQKLSKSEQASVVKAAGVFADRLNDELLTIQEEVIKEMNGQLNSLKVEAQQYVKVLLSKFVRQSTIEREVVKMLKAFSKKGKVVPAKHE